MSQTLKYQLSFIIVLLLGYFISQMDLQAVASAYLKIGTGYVWIFLVSLVAYLLGALAWQACLAKGKFSIWRLFRIRHIGEMLSSINPTSIIAGDGIKYYLLEDEMSDKSQLAASIMISRLLLILAFLLISLVTVSSFALMSGAPYAWVLVIPSLSVFALIYRLMLGLLSKDLWLSATYNKLKDGRLAFAYKAKWAEAILKLNQSTSEYFHTQRNRFYKAGVFSVLHWIVGALEFMLIMYLLDMDVSFGQALFLECGVVMVKNILAFIPGQLGVEELANKVMLQLLAVPDPTIWLTLSVVRRTRQVFWIVVGLLFYLFTFKSKKHENIIYNT